MNDYLIYVFGLKDEKILKHGLGEKNWKLERWARSDQKKFNVFREGREGFLEGRGPTHLIRVVKYV